MSDVYYEQQRSMGLAVLWFLIGFGVCAWIGNRRVKPAADARGYCRALNAAVVADTLCVRGDSIIARVEVPRG